MVVGSVDSAAQPTRYTGRRAPFRVRLPRFMVEGVCGGSALRSVRGAGELGRRSTATETRWQNQQDSHR